ncbi:hypothetical protein HPB50_017153 [Hyalomma asiaticum]|uniref:Uncharacterized protein n=1 Tax=Hyalomma asiaticum TaxID=266040 RepID=A0ACB7TAB0_HYAAI|nr:hypothetical protein HPB50_017153 [Hyalomma asiaticum]
MGTRWPPGAPVPVREVKCVRDREVQPLETLEELLEYQEKPPLCEVVPLSDAIRRGNPGDPRTIFCHDMDGNYKEDRFIHGCNESNVYRFHHWQIIDTFIYYSHHMVTIPPLGWISAAHRHGVKVLGTFTVGDDGTSTIKMVRDAGLGSQVAAQLTKVATVGKFDGWLISIGCKMDRGSIEFVKDFLGTITAEMHKAVPGSLVIWYDSVDVDGNFEPRNELNHKNGCFFDLCDGIFLNFHWTEAMLRSSADFAGSRKADVYAGVDVYARNTSYYGGYDTYKPVLGHAWFNLSKQQLQPRDQGNSLCESCCSVTLHLKDAYDGGGSLRVLFRRNHKHPDAKPYIRLFGCDFPLGPLSVSYTYKNVSICSLVGQDIAIVLKARNVAGETEEIYLGLMAAVPDGDNYIVTRETDRRSEGSAEDSETCWHTRKYQLEDLRGADGAVLEEIGLRFFCINMEPIVCLLGKLDIRRPGHVEAAVPSDKADQGAAPRDDSSSTNDEPEIKRRRVQQCKEDAVQAEYNKTCLP